MGRNKSWRYILIHFTNLSYPEIYEKYLIKVTSNFKVSFIHSLRKNLSKYKILHSDL